MTAADVVDALEAQRVGDSLRMRLLFDTAKAHAELPIPEIHALLDHPTYEPRMAAFCILDFRARRRLDDDERRELAASPDPLRRRTAVTAPLPK